MRSGNVFIKHFRFFISKRKVFSPLFFSIFQLEDLRHWIPQKFAIFAPSIINEEVLK